MSDRVLEEAREKDILLVDDEAGIRKVLGIYLDDAGYRVHQAASGQEALAIFSQFQPRIVLTDIKMPGMDGIELLQQLKHLNPDTEIIMITGHGDIDLAIRSLKYEATDFITKPIHPEALEISLKRARERIALKRQLKAYTEHLERLVEEKSRQLVEAERLAAVGETVAGLSHAIKNIAGGLKGGTFVLEKGIELDNRQYLNEGWEMIRSNVDKVMRLSLDLLEIAKPGQLNCRLTDPNAPLKEVYHLMRSEAARHQIRMELEPSSELQPVWLDADSIHRALLNLVSNAIDALQATPLTDPSRRWLQLKSVRAKGWGVEYRVQDNGCGIPESLRPRLFQRFFSTKGSRGTGIGLMLTKKIVDQHAGEIGVSLPAAGGAEFFIRLPSGSAPGARG
jgi:signal transduction histidine kinase